MASTVDAEHMTESKQRLTGDKFIRPHLRKLSPYQPILPFEVSKELFWLVDLSPCTSFLISIVLLYCLHGFLRLVPLLSS